MSEVYIATSLDSHRWGRDYICKGSSPNALSLPMELRVNLDAPDLDKQKVINALTGLKDYVVGRPKWPPAP